MDLGLFFFAASGAAGGDSYQLLLDSARFADRHGFATVWVPERHFHEFGGPYPNPAVIGAALAVATERIGIRAGSVVAPLHHPVRIAEEWSVVDNLSRGRVGVSFASGWHARDFLLRPENYDRRKDALVETVETVRRLWRGKSVPFTDGTGQRDAVRVYPRPVQQELPVWITSAGSASTFRTAGELGAGVLTHLLGQTTEVLAANIARYRRALADAHGPNALGHVVVMVHTLVGSDRDEVRDTVRGPFTEYLRSAMDLVIASSGLVPPDLDRSMLSARDEEFLLTAAFDRYFTTSGLFGTCADAVRFLARLEGIGVDEVACLIDYGVPHQEVMESLQYLASVLSLDPVTAGGRQ